MAAALGVWPLISRASSWSTPSGVARISVEALSTKLAYRITRASVSGTVQDYHFVLRLYLVPRR
jgi:hypothetical protein